MRLDVYLWKNGYAISRNEAKELIQGGYVSVNGKVIEKPAFETVEPTEIVVSREKTPFVSRGGKKLSHALEHFSVEPSGRVCIDVGASSGGFTDCLLQRGAAHVYAVDSGRDQLVASLRADPRVSVFEGYNARYLSLSDFSPSPTLAVMDVSFISQTLILPSLFDILSPEAELITLVKPQFELDRSRLNKRGIVTAENDRQLAITRVRTAAVSLGFVDKGLIPSPITGGDGNVEYLLYLQKTTSGHPQGVSV